MARSSSPTSPKPNPARIVQARAESGYTQQELAVLARCTLSAIGKYERGQRVPAARILRGIALATRRDVSWFFGDDQEQAA